MKTIERNKKCPADAANKIAIAVAAVAKRLTGGWIEGCADHGTVVNVSVSEGAVIAIVVVTMEPTWVGSDGLIPSWRVVNVSVPDRAFGVQ